MESESPRTAPVGEDAGSGAGRERAMAYEIRVEGELGQDWADWFCPGAFSSAENGTTLVGCALADQAALHGLLRKIRDLGLPLLSVRRVGEGRNG